MAPAPRLTLDEYFRTPETVLPEELVYGALRVADAPSVRHQFAVRDFLLALAAHVTSGQMGEVLPAPIDVVLDSRRDLVIQPDLIFVSRARDHIIRERIWGAPDLVLEVLSPGPRVGELQERVGWFAEYGVRECWLYHQTERMLEVLTLHRCTVRDRRSFGWEDPIASDVLPEFTGPLASVLRHP